MFDTDPTTETITHMPTMIEEEPNPPIIDHTTTTGGEEEEEVRNTSDKATINNDSTTSTATDDKEDEKSNNYYDNIDNEILQTECKGTIVFEDCDETRPPKTTHEQLKKTRMLMITSCIATRCFPLASLHAIACCSSARTNRTA